MTMIAYPFRTSLSKLAVAVTALTITTTAMAAGTIQNVSVSEPNATTTQLNIDFGAQPVQPSAYQLTSPNRLVLDFPNVTHQIANRVQTFDKGSIHDITTLSSNDMTRMIVTLNKDATFSTLVKDNRLIVNVNTTAPAVVATTPVVVTPTPVPTVVTTTPVIVTPPAPVAVVEPVVTTVETPVVVTEPVSPTPVVVATPPVVQPVVVNTPVVKAPNDTMVVKVNPLLNPAAAVSRQYNYDGLAAVNFNGSASGGGNVTIALANDSIPVDVQRTGNEIVVRMTGATVPASLLKKATVGNGLVQEIVTNNQGRNGVIRIVMNGDYEYKAYQTGNQLNISIDPPRRLREPTLEERTYTGAPLSLEFQDVSVRTILEVLGQHTNTNIVASDSVSGNITLRLINVPWDQALDIILKSKNLDKRVNGNVIWVAPAAELQKQEADELKALNDKKELAPLRTEYIRLNYAKAADIRTLIEAGRNRNDDRGNTGSLLSSRGTVTIDERTNTVIVQDTSDVINNIRDLISKLDIPVKQVMIEARIVSASDTFSKELGVKWGILSEGVHSNNNLLVGGSEQTLWDLKKYDIKNQTANGQKVDYPSYTITRPDNLNVNLGTINAATGRIAFGLLSISDMILDLELSAMQADNKGEVISSPKILTADKQTAKVMSGTQIPYQEASASGAATTSFKDAVLSLEVTPNITPEGRIGMELLIENGTPNYATTPVSIDKDSVKTNVILDDGQTVVLGGVFKNRKGNNVDKVPFLGDLPYVDKLFKRTYRTDQKQELLIFVTPKIMNDGRNGIN